jgi:hypothetical protein
MVNTSGNYTFDYNLTNVTPDINESTAFINWTGMDWNSTISSGYDPWIAAMGSWFYVILAIALPVAALIKYRDPQPAAILMILTVSLTIAALPPVVVGVLYTLYALLIMAIIGFVINSIAKR